MKDMKITTEWTLDKFTMSTQADGNGRMTVNCDEVMPAFFINLALDSMDIDYTDYSQGDENDKSYCVFVWEFELEDIKEDCPNLYKKWKAMDDANRPFYLEMQRVLDN